MFNTKKGSLITKDKLANSITTLHRIDLLITNMHGTQLIYTLVALSPRQPQSYQKAMAYYCMIMNDFLIKIQEQ